MFDFAQRHRSLSLFKFIAAAAVGVLGRSSFVHAQAIPFSSSTFTLNHSTYEDQDSGDIPTVTPTTLTITNGGHSDANSSFYETPVSVSGPFTVSFVYQVPGASGNPYYGADGATFTIATTSSTDGTPADQQIGGRGSGLGWGTNDSPNRPATLPNYIANSLAVEFFNYPINNVSYDTGIVTAGATGALAGSATPTGLAFGDPILVSLTYTGTALDETLTDETTDATFSLPAYAVNLPSIVGGNTALIGFTGGTGGDSSTQTFSNLSFTATVPEPATMSVALLGGAGLMLRRRRARR